MRREANEETDGEKLMDEKFDAVENWEGKSACGSVLGRYYGGRKFQCKNSLDLQTVTAGNLDRAADLISAIPQPSVYKELRGVDGFFLAGF